jgi:hypothetical protein
LLLLSLRLVEPLQQAPTWQPCGVPDSVSHDTLLLPVPTLLAAFAGACGAVRGQQLPPLPVLPPVLAVFPPRALSPPPTLALVQLLCSLPLSPLVPLPSLPSLPLFSLLTISGSVGSSGEGSSAGLVRPPAV